MEIILNYLKFHTDNYLIYDEYWIIYQMSRDNILEDEMIYFGDTIEELSEFIRLDQSLKYMWN